MTNFWLAIASMVGLGVVVVAGTLALHRIVDLWDGAKPTETSYGDLIRNVYRLRANKPAQKFRKRRRNAEAERARQEYAREHVTELRDALAEASR